MGRIVGVGVVVAAAAAVGWKRTGSNKVVPTAIKLGEVTFVDGLVCP